VIGALPAALAQQESIALLDELQGGCMIGADQFNGKSVLQGAVSKDSRFGGSCGIAFMAKASAPGRAKTRLVPPLTFDQAADLNTVFLQDVADNLIQAARHAPAPAAIVGYAAYGPPGSADFFRHILPQSIGLIEAWLPNFGDCLFYTIGEILARGHDSAVVLNSDSPTLPTALLVETAAVLARPGNRAVLGPSTDGGYYLLGLKSAHRRKFEDITWSTERVAEQTLARAREIGLEVHMLPAWYDVDDIDSLRRLDAELRGLETATPPGASHWPRYAAHTAALIQQFARDRDFGRAAACPLAIDPVHA
jgi:rSAM/selenodomain-associated transferase 1